MNLMILSQLEILFVMSKIIFSEENDWIQQKVDEEKKLRKRKKKVEKVFDDEKKVKKKYLRKEKYKKNY